MEDHQLHHVFGGGVCMNLRTGSPGDASNKFEFRTRANNSLLGWVIDRQTRSIQPSHSPSRKAALVASSEDI